ncbi:MULTISPECIES: heptaprenyl diphosphate synthase component 1 [Bacillales]|jgi:heptaprenyl diphosphate synthase|uniref:Heptaprenyl diphosphate synthase n=1 Tax=Brevibacillus aydinogluensis TaxID=927786 RepID=A0AA48RHY4_9BACL|nr:MULTISPECIES: heptaprenyl diphosphate synthase component 1 [Bacillales]REK62236.1 MAG: heptaprenyl diphosphate synthase [Brevibacillus sp.]MBR8658561.1 heptaprenyl diphosphate synthase component 1 [Brevibacillus sp. NL20B1]MDT3415369.1 heptaprenyl diphosphate synthase [Brevibacillus aydinogluensis]NNV02153.1 heptaprenyl diphosphate synthase [Brevibacillus sp. MCWH]UFJ60455.1 heptaprenyl diphosphate synthase component 1 [Anoxybacillus sediminis]
MNKEQTTYVDEVRAIIDQICQSITHSFVEQYVDVPAIAENRLALLYLFLLERGMTKERARTFTMSTALVQLGLDMHENVKNSYDNSLAAERNRQLTVLAGDYYSSRYYQMLAEAGEMEAIQVLSGAIQRVNEAKMKLYMAERDGRLSSDEYLTLRTEIDTGLYVAIVDKYADNEETRRFWTALFAETAAVENMLGEWEQLKWQQQVPFGFSRFLLQKPGATIAQVAAALEAKAMELMSICEQLVRSLHPPETRHVLTWITSRYSHRVNRLKRVIEEL